jgi:riboflavin synthase
VKQARKELNEHLRAWEKIGMTHRDKRAAMDARVAVVEATVKESEAEVWRKTDPAAKKRAQEVVAQLTESIANYEKAAAKYTASGNEKKSAEAAESAAARKVWLAEAEKGLAEYN